LVFFERLPFIDLRTLLFVAEGGFGTVIFLIAINNKNTSTGLMENLHKIEISKQTKDKIISSLKKGESIDEFLLRLLNIRSIYQLDKENILFYNIPIPLQYILETVHAAKALGLTRIESIRFVAKKNNVGEGTVSEKCTRTLGENVKSFDELLNKKNHLLKAKLKKSYKKFTPQIDIFFKSLEV